MNDENNENRLVIKCFNQKQRNKSITYLIVLIICGVMFLLAGAFTFNTICTVFGAISIACGVLVVVIDYFAQKEVYDVFTPEYYVHIKNGKEGERVYWDTVHLVNYSALTQSVTSRQTVGNTVNFQIDYKTKDANGNYNLGRKWTYIPENYLTAIQNVIPVVISGGKYLTEQRREQLIALLEDEEDTEPEEELSTVENTAENGEVKTAQYIQPYINIPPVFKSLLICGVAFGLIAIIAYIVYAFVAVEPVVIVSMVCSFSAVICVELSALNIRAIYRAGYNPYKTKTAVLCIISFLGYLGISIYSLVTYDEYIPKLICIVGFVLGTAVFLAESLYFILKKQPPHN